MALAPKSVAQFYYEIMELLRSLDIDVRINRMPQEVPNPIRFDEDNGHASYDRDAVNRCWRAFVHADRLMQRFRSGFIGKCSPVNFYWGSFDLAVTRFSGRRAPDRPEADLVTREAYSHEVISCGFWPGSGNVEGPAFYVYSAPEPTGFAMNSHVQPKQAFYNPPTAGYVLMYDDVRSSSDPDRMVLDFFQSTYDIGADLAKWDRASFERTPVERPMHAPHESASEIAKETTQAPSQAPSQVT